MRATVAHRSPEAVLRRPLDDNANNGCDLVDVLLGLRRSGFFRFEADASCAALLLAEVRHILSLQSAVLRLRCHESHVFEIRLGRFPYETLS